MGRRLEQDLIEIEENNWFTFSKLLILKLKQKSLVLRLEVVESLSNYLQLLFLPFHIHFEFPYNILADST